MSGKRIRNLIRVALLAFMFVMLYIRIEQKDWGSAIVTSMLLSITFSTLEEDQLYGKR